MTCKRCEERLITDRDVEAVIREHMAQLDALWPDTERYGPRKVHLVELIQGIKLRLLMRAEKNAAAHVTAFEAAARKITGYDPNTSRVIETGAGVSLPTDREQNEALKTRIKRGQA